MADSAPATALLADLLVALNLGLLSQVHCVAMCGGVVGALGLATAPARRDGGSVFGFALAYNAGRISSYVITGALLAALGGGLLTAFSDVTAHRVLRLVAAAVLLVAGLSLLGVKGPGAVLEHVGARWWGAIQRRGRGLLPVTTLPRAWAMGMLWGWMPCALVYATLLFAATAAAPLRAALIMLAFGLGTAPAMIAGAGMAGGATRWLAGAGVRRIAGITIIALALAYPFVDLLMPVTHHHHGG